MADGVMGDDGDRPRVQASPRNSAAAHDIGSAPSQIVEDRAHTFQDRNNVSADGSQRQIRVHDIDLDENLSSQIDGEKSEFRSARVESNVQQMN